MKITLFCCCAVAVVLCATEARMLGRAVYRKSEFSNCITTCNGENNACVTDCNSGPHRGEALMECIEICRQDHHGCLTDLCGPDARMALDMSKRRSLG